MTSPSSLSAEIDKLIQALGGMAPSPAVSRLEREIALLVWTLRVRRMSATEHAAYVNGLARRWWISGDRPLYSLHTRLEDLIEEVKKW